MCPDKSLLSALFDGEVPEPYRSELKQHVDQCQQCQKTLQGFGRIETFLSASPEPEVHYSAQRVLAQVQSQRRRRSWLHSRVALPMPAFAAAFCALVVLAAVPYVLNLGSGTGKVESGSFAASVVPESEALAAGLRGRPSPVAFTSRLGQSQEGVFTIDIPIESIEEVRRLFDRQKEDDSAVMIELPDQGSYSMTGDPVFLQPVSAGPRQ